MYIYIYVYTYICIFIFAYIFIHNKVPHHPDIHLTMYREVEVVL
jgi:pterin-4a-carbinolamine dehydratase